MEAAQGARGFEGKDLFQDSVGGNSSKKPWGVELDKLREQEREEMVAQGWAPTEGGADGSTVDSLPLGKQVSSRSV